MAYNSGPSDLYNPLVHSAVHGAMGLPLRVQDFGASSGLSNQDNTAAFQAAIDYAANLGGGTILVPPAVYKINGPLTWRDGVQMVGSGSSHGRAQPPSYLRGTMLDFSSAPAETQSVTFPGVYGMGLSGMHFYGNRNTDLFLLDQDQTGTLVARSGFFRDISCSNFRETFSAKNFSYVDLIRVNISSSTRALHVYPPTGPTKVFQEFLWLDQVNMGADDKCIWIQGGSQMYFNDVDTNDANYNVYIEGGYSNEFVGLNCVRAKIKGIYFYPDANQYVTDTKFKDTTIFMLGANASETAVEFDRQATNTTTEPLFDQFRISKSGSTAPTYSILMNASSCSNAWLIKGKDASGGKIRTNGCANAKVQLQTLQEAWTQIWSGDGTKTAFVQTISNASPFYDYVPTFAISTNQTIPFSVTVSNTPGGAFTQTVTFATAPSAGTNNVKISYVMV